MDDAGKIAERIRDSDVWSLEDCRALCHAVGLGESWDDATAEDFEEIVVRAGNLVGVEIL